MSRKISSLPQLINIKIGTAFSWAQGITIHISCVCKEMRSFNLIDIFLVVLKTGMNIYTVKPCDISPIRSKGSPLEAEFCYIQNFSPWAQGIHKLLCTINKKLGAVVSVHYI